MPCRTIVPEQTASSGVSPGAEMSTPWSGDQLLMEVPHWSEDTLAPDEQMVLATLDANADQPQPEALALLPALLPGAHYPQTSLDQRYLAFDTWAGLAVGRATAEPGGRPACRPRSSRRSG